MLLKLRQCIWCRACSSHAFCLGLVFLLDLVAMLSTACNILPAFTASVQLHSFFTSQHDLLFKAHQTKTYPMAFISTVPTDFSVCGKNMQTSDHNDQQQ